MVVAVDTTEDQATVDQWVGRELTSAVQKLRKSGGLLVGDAIEVFFEETSTAGEGVVGCFAAALANPEVLASVTAKLGGAPLPLASLPSYLPKVGLTSGLQVHTSELTVAITRLSPSVAVSSAAVSASYPVLTPAQVGVACALVGSCVLSGAVPSAKATVSAVVDGQVLSLKKGVHVFGSVAELAAAEAKK
jgi:hypothetical protein